MSRLTDAFDAGARDCAAGHQRRSRKRAGTPRNCPRVTIRLSEADYARLVELADGMALSTYIRALALNESMSKRKQRSVSAVADQKVIGQVLGLLGQSRIANNLNQLAYQANIGALQMNDEALAQIEETYAHVVAMRGLLLKALGGRS